MCAHQAGDDGQDPGATLLSPGQWSLLLLAAAGHAGKAEATRSQCEV